VIPIGRQLPDGTWIVSVDVFEESVVVRWFKRPTGEGLVKPGGLPASVEAQRELDRGTWAPIAPTRRSHWALVDDASTIYTLVADHAFGNDVSESGYVIFEPIPPRAARYLSFHAGETVYTEPLIGLWPS
jgi:hypothetical protein